MTARRTGEAGVGGVDEGVLNVPAVIRSGSPGLTLRSDVLILELHDDYRAELSPRRGYCSSICCSERITSGR